MLFYDSVDQFENVFTDKELNIEKEQESIDCLFNFMSIDFNQLQYFAEIFFGKKPFKSYERDLTYFKDSPRSFTVSIRPKAEYYEALGKRKPLTLDSNGVSATGLEIGLEVYRFIPQNESVLTLNLTICGKEERLAFKQLFYDHRRIVELLLKKIKIQFSTSCVFTKLENYRGKDLRKILELYFSEEDVENKIDLYCEYRHGESPESLIEAFPVFFAIFDSVYHYSKPRKDFDKIIDYYLKLR